VEGVRLRIVQPNISQSDKDNPVLDEFTFDRHLTLSNNVPLAGVTHLIWPETAVPYILTEAPGAIAAIGAVLPPGTSLITGAPRAERGSVSPERAVTNSILVVNDRGEIVDSYDKVHLVPFGEYLPFADFLEPLGIRQMIALPGGFTAGLDRRPLTSFPAPAFAPLICYEAIFPGEVLPDGERPGWLLNVTNDAWFGDSQGPRQHFRQARLRAVEEGLPLVRAANTGISAIVDAYGRVGPMLDVGEEGTLDGDLPVSLPATLYAQYRDAIPGALVLMSLFTAFIGSVARRKGNN
jgi:apolipoprotein N-acyltransferase